MESFESSSENRFRVDSLLGRINSLLPRIKFPVVVELIPCSVAQGIHLREPRKLLNSQMFLGRIFAGAAKIEKIRCCFPVWQASHSRRLAGSVVSQGWIPAFAGMTQGQRTSF
jgi:hypothetical protein